MRDVMQGMLCFTHENCRDSESAKMDILAVEEAENTVTQTATVIPFPGKNTSSGKLDHTAIAFLAFDLRRYQVGLAHAHCQCRRAGHVDG